MVSVMTRAQYLHLNYVAGETEGGGRGREGGSLIARLSLLSLVPRCLGTRLFSSEQPGNEAIAKIYRSHAMEELVWK